MAKSTKIANDNAITLSELQEELRVRWDLPFSVFVSGPAGVGKSAVFKQLVAEIATGDRFAKWTFKNGIEVCGKEGNEFGFIDYRLAQIEPQDLAGIPMPENGTTRRFLPSELPVVGNDTVPEQGLLFLDEANQADITVQKAMFSLILDRKVAGSKNIKKNHAQKVRSIAAIIGRSAAELYTSFLEAAQAIDVEALLSGICNTKRKTSMKSLAKVFRNLLASWSWITKMNLSTHNTFIPLNCGSL